MALSLAPQVLWDFQRVTTPLTDMVAAITLTHDGTSVNTTDGLVVPATLFTNAYVNSPPAVLRPARPFTLVFGIRYTDTNATQTIPRVVGWYTLYTNEGSVTAQPTLDSNSAAQIRVTLQNGAGDSDTSNFWDGLDSGTEYILVAEYTGTTAKLWVNGTLRVNRSGTFSGVFGADLFAFGKYASGSGTSYHFPYSALYHGQLSAGDLTALGSSFATGRSAIFAAPPAPSAFRSYYITG
jgi:hypothetical protein